MKVSIFKLKPGFKITRKWEIKAIFFDDVLKPDNRYVVTFNDNGEGPPNTQIILFTDKDNNVTVYQRYGDLSDIFNPEVQVRDEIGFIWKYRKYINDYFFSSERKYTR